MNTYITKSLNQIKTILTSSNNISYEEIDSIIGDIEMMKMEIEQHIENMDETEKNLELKKSAEHSIQKLTEVLEVLEDINDSEKTEHTRNELTKEIADLIDEICY